MSRYALLALALSLAPTALAHGYLANVTIDGTTHVGNVPNGHTNPSPIRQINDIGPVKGADNPFMLCGQAAQLASQVAPANPGSVVEFLWKDGDNTNWPHEIGPLMTYMAPCQGTCDTFNGTGAQWFKIDELGQKPNSNGVKWFQGDVQQGQAISVTLPNDLAPGDYLIRHEIIALHLADSLGGAEFYPSCTQVRIGGSGSTQPDSSDTTQFPGGYSDNDPGIFDKDIFNPGNTYIFPGPPVSNLAAPADSASENGGQAPSGALSGSATVTESAPAATGTANSSPTSANHNAPAPSSSSVSAGQGQPQGASSGGKTCGLRKRDAANAMRDLVRRDAGGYARHVQRARWSAALRGVIGHS